MLTISHVAGKYLITVGTLSRAHSLQDDELCNQAKAYVDLVCRNLPASDEHIKE